jgi:hypothetical protein
MSVYPSKRTLIERIGNLLRAITGDFQTFFTHHPLTYAKLGIRIERVMTDDDRQWLVLSVNDVQGRLQTPRHSPDLHQAIHSADERQS